MTSLAPRIGNDVSYVRQIPDDLDIAWQAQYLVRLAGALRDILGDSRDAKCCILQYKIVSKMGRVRSPKRRVRDDDFMVGSGRIWSDILGLSSNRLSIGGSIQGVSAEILSFKISWQVRLEGDFTCSTHWK